MPSSILSHQAPALYLKHRYPKKIDGTAICLSTFVPDILFFLNYNSTFSIRNITHSFLGIFVWTLPVTLILTMLFSRYFGPWISVISKKDWPFTKYLKYFGFDKFDRLKLKSFDRSFYVRASYSAIIGGITHLLLDLPSHSTVEFFFPLVVFSSPELLLIPIYQFGSYSFQVYELIWLLESAVTIPISLYYLRTINKNKIYIA